MAQKREAQAKIKQVSKNLSAIGGQGRESDK